MIESKKQISIISELSHIIKDKQLKYFIKTFGCQMNEKQSETLCGVLETIGYEETTDETQADFVLYNTCTVRENAELKVYGRLGHLKSFKRKNPNLIIALCGCMMQQETTVEEIKKTQKHVDIIFGTFNFHKLPELIKSFLETKETIIDIWEEHKEIVEDLPTHRKYDFKACVNIMYGCNNFCSYCIVPYVRGRERSRKPEDIVIEVENLVKEGAKEIMLLGQNVNSYGIGLEEKVSFPELLKMLNEIEGLERIRFMTSHPKDFTDELIYAIRDYDKVCNYVHLPVQAGSNDVLEKMNRKYTREDYIGKIKKLKEIIPEVTVSTDIIVGFPGETEEDFDDTINMLKEVKYNSAFMFLYSKRTGTPAATMDSHIEEHIMKKRFNRLSDTLDEVMYENATAQIGKTLKVLVEDESRSKDGVISGRSDTNYIVHFKGDKNLIGSLVNVKIVNAKTYYLMGQLI